MKIKTHILYRFFIALTTTIFFCSCANIIPPSGGTKDTLAPIQIMAFPKDSSLNFNAKKITLTFNEYVEAKEIQQNVVVNPLPKTQPLIEYKLQNVFITLKDSLEPNTTYTINFGNAIKDINEGNIYKNKVYVFSTGNTIDNKTISGKVILAQDGKIDSTLIAVLHPNIADSSVKKLRPKYMAKLNGEGKFLFTNLPNQTFNLFILPNDYSKKYDDSTKLFAFLNKPISTIDSITNYTLYAYREFEPVEKKQPQKQEDNKTAAQQKLKYTLNITNSKCDILDTAIVINFSKKIKVKDVELIQLTDTNYKKIEGYNIIVDTTNSSIIIKNKLALKTSYKLVINKDAVTDTIGNSIAKSDTVRFTTLTQEDYGNIKIRANTNTTNAVLQIISNGKLYQSIPFTSKIIERKIFKPGEYELRVLLDENNNAIWDAGNYEKKKQPEKVMAISTKLIVKANWDNEIEITW